jgi:hypothetical protein
MAVGVFVAEGMIVSVTVDVVVAVGVPVAAGGVLDGVGVQDAGAALGVPTVDVAVIVVVGVPRVGVRVLDAVGMPVAGTRVGVALGIGVPVEAASGDAVRVAVGDAVAGARVGATVGVSPRPRLTDGVLEDAAIAGAGDGLVLTPASPVAGVLASAWICWRTAWTVGASRVAFGTMSLAGVGAARSASRAAPSCWA